MAKRTSFAFLSLVLAGLAVAAPPAALSQDTPQERDPFYCEERKLGSWFYCDPDKIAEEEAKDAPQPSVPATARLAAITAELDELKARAVLDPTEENVTQYIRFQREQLDRASMFADVWSRAVWQNPELDYTLQRPVNTLGKQTWTDQRKLARQNTMEALAQRYGVFYFYSSTCAACQVFSPIMRSISDQFGLEVLAVSMDGGPNDAFPNFVVDTGQYERMGLGANRQVPALVLFDTQTKQPIPIGYGLMAADEVMQRIYYLTETEPGSDY